MKKNSIKELEQRIEELYRTQQARLDVGADDLDIREEIAEVEEKIKESKEMELIELFGGIGACTKALKNIGMNVDVVDYVEIDKYAVKSYNAINGTNFEPQDIREWDKDINVDLIMHGSPCQDYSISGLQMGGDEGSGTRSSLMYESIRIINKLKPKYVVWENVKNLLSKKHKHNFDNYINKLNELDYNSYYQVLNAKDYGIPQNRERVYTISIRKDIDNGNFKFPEKEELKLRLKDILEDKVDEKYYLSNSMINCFTETNKNESNFPNRVTDNFVVDRLGGIFDSRNSKHQAGSIYNKYGICPTLDTMQGGWRQPLIIDNKKFTNELTRELYGSIRKLTPLECWRLMGFDDEDFYNAQSTGNSNSQLYKQARKLNCSKGFRKNIFKFI